MYKFRTGNQVKHIKSGRILTLSGQIKGKWRLFDGEKLIGFIATTKLSEMILKGDYEIMDSVKIHKENICFSVLIANNLM